MLDFHGLLSGNRPSSSSGCIASANAHGFNLASAQCPYGTRLGTRLPPMTGSKLYFSSTLRLKGTDAYGKGKIFESATKLTPSSGSYTFGYRIR